MIKAWRLSMARRMTQRRSRPVGTLSALATWLPFWCVPVAIFLYVSTGFEILLVLPVLVVGRYFVARRTADMVLTKFGDIIRLKHPLPQTLKKVGGFEPGLVGVRLITIGELLEQGRSVTESLRLGLPEIQSRRLGAIAAAESQGMLVAEFNRQNSPSEKWNVFTELDTSQLVYFALLALGILLAGQLISRFLPPRFAAWHIPAWQYPRILVTHGVLTIILFASVCIVPIVIGGVLLRRLFVPFYRRAEGFLFWRDAVLWRAPLWGGIVQTRSWAAATEVLATGFARGAPLPQNCKMAAEATRNRVARRRLLYWGQLLESGEATLEAANKAHLPKPIRRAVAMPGDLIEAGLKFAAQSYQQDYRRAMQWVRAAGIPMAVLFFGALVLYVMLMVYVPYSHLLAALCRSTR